MSQPKESSAALAGYGNVDVSPHEFEPLKRWFNRGRCARCLAHEELHPALGYLPARPMFDNREAIRVSPERPAATKLGRYAQHVVPGREGEARADRCQCEGQAMTAATADGWTLRTEKYRARATDVLTNPEVAERTTLDLMIREELARDVLALCAEIETAREIIASERRRAAHAESLLVATKKITAGLRVVSDE